MYHRTTIGSTVILSKNGPIKNPHRVWQGSVIAVVNNAKFLNKTFQKVSPRNPDEIRLFFDKDDLLLSEFDEFPDVIDKPIDAIIIYENQVKVFVASRLIHFDFNRFPSYCLTEKFYMGNDISEEPKKKKMRMMTTSTPQSSPPESCSDIFSDEIDESFITDSLIGQTDELERDESMTTCTSQKLVDESNVSLVKQIIPTQLDRKLQLEIQIDECQQRLEEVFESSRIPTKLKILPISQLKCSQKWQSDEKTVKSVANSIEEDGSLREGDPITVVKKNDFYLVLSGSKRIQACQEQGVDTVSCHTLGPTDVVKFSLRNFFAVNCKKEPTIRETIVIFKDLLVYLLLAPTDLAIWTDVNIRKVFGKWFNLESKIGRIFKVVIQQPLADKIESICRQNVELTSRCLFEILNKYRLNPLETIGLLERIDAESFEEKIFRRNLALIQPDLSTLLTKKIGDHSLVSKLINTFSKDEKFTEFIRSADLRKVTSSNYIHFVSSRFESYKMARTTSTTNTKPCNITIAIPNESTNILLCGNQSVAMRWLSSVNGSHKPRIVIVFGQILEGSSVHSIVIPDSLGVRNQFSMIINRMTVSIFVKKAKMLENSQFCEFFQHEGMNYAETYSLEDFKKLIKPHSTCFVDLPCILDIDFCASLVDGVKIVQVRDELYQGKLQKSIHNRKQHNGSTRN